MTQVSELKIDSAGGAIVIHVQRDWTARRAEATDLPEDVRTALLKWLHEDVKTEEIR